MGAFGSGESAGPAGLLTRKLLSTFMREELVDKVAADALILKVGGTVFHAGPLSDKPLSATRRTVTLDKVGTTPYIPGAGQPRYRGGGHARRGGKPKLRRHTVVPLER